MNDATTPPDRKYAVFISYRHEDNKAQGRQWATWLHHTLETYEIPPDLVGRTNLRGEPVPASLYPVFRDEEELPADADLSANIQRALRHSALLVVLCSPRAVASRFVADEIRVFKELGKAGHILALMIDGEPNATDDPGKARAGIRPEHECLPEPLRYGGPRADGSIDWTQRTEPIAADVRPQNQPVQGWTTAAAYREELTRQGLAKPEIERLGVAYEEQLQLATMKIIAGAIGLPLGEVTQRDKRHAEEKLKRARQELSRTEFLFARQLLDSKDYPKAYARLSKAIEVDPENRIATVLGLEEIRRRANCGVLRRYLHEDRVNSAVFSPDGARILTASNDRTARLWDAATGRLLAEPLRHDGWVCSAVFSPDGARILTASQVYSEPSCARLWDATTGQPLKEPLWHERWLCSAVFSPNGAWILTASLDKTARLWDAATGQPLAEPMRHEDSVYSAVFSPDSARILTITQGRVARLWDASTGRPFAEPLRLEGFVRSAVFSPDGARILTASDDRTARLWDAAFGQPLAEPMRHENVVSSAEFSPDGARILTISWDHIARLWDATTGQPLAEPMRHKGGLGSAVFSPDGARILTTSDHIARLWDATTGQPLAESLRHEGRVSSAVFSPDGARILTTSDHTAWLWDATTGQPLAESLRYEGKVSSAVFSPDGARILTASSDKTARLWDAATGQPLVEPLRHEDEVNSAVFSPDGARILTASSDKTARLWDAPTGQPHATPLRHEGIVWSAVFSPDGSLILTASDDSTARLWNAVNGQPQTNPLRHDAGVISAVFSSDAARILTASEEPTARLWDAVTGQPLGEPMRHEDTVLTAMFSPDGARILTASVDTTARLWDAATGQPLTEPLRHDEGFVWSAEFSPDGSLILTAASDKTARLWDAVTGLPLTEPMRHEGAVNSAVFSSDGARILTASDDKTTRLWDASTGELLAQDRLRLRQLLEAIGSHRLNQRGLLEPVPPPDIERLRREFDTAPEMNRLFHWWWSDPFTRTINPSSAITVPKYVRRRIREILDLEDEKAKPRCLQDSRDAFLNHPLVLLCEAKDTNTPETIKASPVASRFFKWLGIKKTAQTNPPEKVTAGPAWLRQHAVSRLLAEPHYLTPLEPPNAIGDAKANRQYELTLGLAEDCFLGARLLLNDRTGQTRTTDPKRIELTKQVLVRALKLAPENEAYRKLAAEIGM